MRARTRNALKRENFAKSAQDNEKSKETVTIRSRSKKDIERRGQVCLKAKRKHVGGKKCKRKRTKKRGIKCRSQKLKRDKIANGKGIVGKVKTTSNFFA